MTYEQKKLFPEAEKLKFQQGRVTRMTRSVWDRLWKKDYDPGYLIKIQSDDIPSMRKIYEQTMGMNAVILSKGPEDLNRRVIAWDGKGWVVGLFVSLLQRQVREGTDATKGVCYATLTHLECDGFWMHVVDRWSQELLVKRRF